MDTIHIIEGLLAAKSTISFGEAKVQLGLGPWVGASDCKPVAAEFEGAMAGSSALLVDGNGKYATKPETEGHHAWLQGHGYEDGQLPTFKPVRVKKAKTQVAMNAKIAAILATDLPSKEKAAIIAAL